tara:strand:+ start:3064 stop:3759 length:696 start_codon:yes stop_codon:yes gene_type:complete
MNIVNGILFYSFLTITYCGLDRILNKYYKGNYYFLHGVSNMFITYICIEDVKHSYLDLNNFSNYQINYIPSIITFSLHSYHIISYFNKLLFDDWLHHILMCGIALPVGINMNMNMNSGYLMNHGLFFLTGLPGGINYINMFLTRNNYMNNLTQKRINNILNLWIRAPGCISHSALTLVAYNMNKELFTENQKYMVWCTMILTFWNGIYFMEQVVTNYAVEQYKDQQNKIEI